MNCTIDETGNFTGSENYTMFNISINNTLSLRLTATTPIQYPTITNFVGSGCPAELTCTLNVTNGIFPVGNISANYTTIGNGNYTFNATFFTVNIQKGTGLIYTYVDNSRSDVSMVIGNSIWLNASLITGNGNILLFNNETLINNGTSPLANYTPFITLGLYNITSIYPGNENYTFDSETFYITALSTLSSEGGAHSSGSALRNYECYNKTGNNCTLIGTYLTCPTGLMNLSIEVKSNFTITEEDIINTCSNLSLKETSKCLVNSILPYFIYNLTDDRIDLNWNSLLIRGGDCQNWAKEYSRLGEKLGFYSEVVIMNIDEKSSHAIALLSSEEKVYCIIDQRTYYCSSLI
ncbi:hypothetical protein CCP1ISM_590002 [Azospirillaceae bacterium]